MYIFKIYMNRHDALVSFRLFIILKYYCSERTKTYQKWTHACIWNLNSNFSEVESRGHGHCINLYIISTWQDDWNGAAANKPVLGNLQSSYRRCRKDEVVFASAIHIWPIHISWGKIIHLCEHCQCILTVRHILVECNNFAQETKDIFGRRDVMESFSFHPTLIVLLLKQI